MEHIKQILKTNVVEENSAVVDVVICCDGHCPKIEVEKCDLLVVSGEDISNIDIF